MAGSACCRSPCCRWLRSHGWRCAADSRCRPRGSQCWPCWRRPCWPAAPGRCSRWPARWACARCGLVWLWPRHWCCWCTCSRAVRAMPPSDSSWRWKAPTWALPIGRLGPACPTRRRAGAACLATVMAAAPPRWKTGWRACTAMTATTCAWPSSRSTNQRATRCGARRASVSATPGRGSNCASRWPRAMPTSARRGWWPRCPTCRSSAAPKTASACRAACSRTCTRAW